MQSRWPSDSPGLFRRLLVPALAASLVLPTTIASAQEPAPAPTAEPAPAPAPVEAAPAAPAPEPVAAPEPVSVSATTTFEGPSPVPVHGSPTVEGEQPAEYKTPEIVEEPADTGSITIGGWIEAYYAHNFNNPQNHTTANRWVDEKTDSFTLQTFALDISAQKGPFSAMVTLMFGPTADRWYFEGSQIPSQALPQVLDANGYSNETFKNVMTAYGGYKAPVGKGLLIEAGLLPTQVGYETTPVKNNFNFSRSNLFNFLPFFHLGARATYPLTDNLTVTAGVFNGWNQLIDRNIKKSVSLQTSYSNDDWLFNLLYFGGAERSTRPGNWWSDKDLEDGSKSGMPWRNMFDAVAQYTGIPNLILAAELNGGWEAQKQATQKWVGAGLWAQLKLTDWLFVAGRGDGIAEGGTGNWANGRFITIGDGHIVSGTGTLELRPLGDGFSFRVEYRHDSTNKDNELVGFYKGRNNTFVNSQNTVNVGVTGWF
ncbi:MAG: outer membrane beta-barrel protein [Myxococcales bacterium]